jgi:predicted RNase H-like nuclease (RuvC/YqgF family)
MRRRRISWLALYFAALFAGLPLQAIAQDMPAAQQPEQQSAQISSSESQPRASPWDELKELTSELLNESESLTGELTRLQQQVETLQSELLELQTVRDGYRNSLEELRASSASSIQEKQAEIQVLQDKMKKIEYREWIWRASAIIAAGAAVGGMAGGPVWAAVGAAAGGLAQFFFMK